MVLAVARAGQEDSRVSRRTVGCAGAGGAKGFARRGFQALTHACVQEEKLRDQKDRRGGGTTSRLGWKHVAVRGVRQFGR